MENNNLLQNIDISNLQVDYSQMQIPFINDILNADFLGFNNLGYPVRIIILVIILICFITIGKRIFLELLTVLKKIFRFINNKFEKFSEKRFNTLVSTQLNNRIAKSNTFIIICNFNFREQDNRIEILTEFSKAFLINNPADSVKYEKSSIIYEFSNFHKIINSVITQLFITKALFEKNHQLLEIYLGGTIVEKETEIENKVELVNNLNLLKISKSGLICDSIFNLYYSLIKPQLYEIQSVGEYLIQNNTIETFILTKPIDRSI